ncbi:hypothetical protein UlMin_035352 [Ulmus minor]
MSWWWNMGIIVGMTSLVGNSLAEILPLSDTPGSPWKFYGVSQRPQPNWNTDHHVQYIQCNIFDPNVAQNKLYNQLMSPISSTSSRLTAPLKPRTLKPMKKEGLSWSIHCPNIIFKFSPYNLMNLTSTLYVYATICKHEGRPLKKNGLELTKLEEAGVWWFADFVLGGEEVLDGMNKSKEHRFVGFRNSNKSFVS